MPAVGLLTLLWVILGLPVSVVLVPILGVVFFRKTCGWYLSLIIFILLIPILAPILYLATIVYIVSFCGWKPQSRTKVNQVQTNPFPR